MKKGLLLAILSAAISLLVALGLIRWLAPGLLGIATDLQLVQVSDEVPPFFANVFREADLGGREFILRDPQSISRAAPLYPELYGMGPNDLLGFRNRAVPNVAEIVTLGDSQTYGNNVMLEESWPHRLPHHLGRPETVVYNMSCGAWNGPQYLEMARYALHLEPRVLVVAFYSGNDPVGAFTAAYGAERWADLQPDASLGPEDAPRVRFPAPPEEVWSADFADGSRTAFTPTLRLASNLPGNAVVTAGWEILAGLARRVAALAASGGARSVFTVIPTKELVYAERVRSEGLVAPADYDTLVDSERAHIARFEEALRGLDGAVYVDVLDPLQAAAGDAMLYPDNENGHPLAAGYDVIARAIAPSVAPALPEPLRGLVFVQYPDGSSRPLLARDDGYFVFASRQVMAANGWAAQPTFRLATPRDLAGLRYLGTVAEVDRARYGPPGRP